MLNFDFAPKGKVKKQDNLQFSNGLYRMDFLFDSLSNEVKGNLAGQKGAIKKRIGDFWAKA